MKELTPEEMKQISGGVTMRGGNPIIAIIDTIKNDIESLFGRPKLAR